MFINFLKYWRHLADELTYMYYVLIIPSYLAPGGGCEVLFWPYLYVCMSICVSVCPANILVFYFSAIRREIYTGYI